MGLAGFKTAANLSRTLGHTGCSLDSVCAQNTQAPNHTDPRTPRPRTTRNYVAMDPEPGFSAAARSAMIGSTFRVT